MRKGYTLIQLCLGLAAVLVIATAMIYTTQRLASQAPSVRNRPATGNSNAVACTADAKECPDGSFVGRVLPNCEFAACPESNTNSGANTNTAADATEGWKTYTNAKYGYSIQFPSDWVSASGYDGSESTIVNNEVNHNYFTGRNEGKSGKGLVVQVCTTAQVVECSPNTVQTWRQNKTISKETSVKLGTATFTRVMLDQDPTVWYITEQGAYFYEIRVQDTTDRQIDSILSTFQFTDQTAATKGWKTYTNTTYGYSIKYPDDYRVTPTPNGDLSVLIEKGVPGAAGYQFISILSVEEGSATSKDGNNVYTWARDGFPFDDPITRYHVNPRNVTLGELSFVATDGDRGSSGIPEYFIFHNNTLYQFGSYSPGAGQTTNKEVISTLQFTD